MDNLKGKILKALECRRPTSVSELSRKLGVRREYLTGFLACLEELNLIEHFKVGKSYAFEKKALKHG